MDLVTDPPDAVSVEPLTKDRAEQLADQLIAMIVDSTWDSWGREQLLATRAQKWERSLLATRGGRPVGWAVVSQTDRGAHLHHIVVAKHERSAGVGALLMTELLRRTRPGVLTLKVHPDNAAAARFYLRLGFDEQSRSPSGYRVFSSRASDDKESAT